VVAVQLADALFADELDGEMPVLDSGSGQRRERRRAQLLGRADEVDLNQFPCCWRRGARSAGACFSAYSL
jgi:hypothetical protein